MQKLNYSNIYMEYLSNPLVELFNKYRSDFCTVNTRAHTHTRTNTYTHTHT